MKYSIIIFSCICISLFSCRNKQLETAKNEPDCSAKVINKEWNGVNLVAISSKIDSTAISPIVKLNANSVAIIPFGFLRTGKSSVEFNLDWQWHGEKKVGTIEQIQLAKKAGLKVLLKPHLWTHDGWVGDLEFIKESDWKNFETTYTKFIIDFAQIADSMEVELFCVGVELRKVTVNRPDYWNQLIDSIRTIYKGKLTYAANWDNYENVTFWNKLDYIGIDAYFPVSEEKTPSIKSLLKGWQISFDKIKMKSLNEEKPVIFTEFGYRNVDFTGKEPWETKGLSSNNMEAQDNAYQALFCKFWDKPWFAGGFLWKWYPNHNEAGGKESNRFTPQNKPVEEIIRKQYSISK